MKMLADYWIPALALIMICAGIAFVLASKLRPRNFKPTVEPINLNANQITSGTLHPRHARGRFKPRS